MTGCGDGWPRDQLGPCARGCRGVGGKAHGQARALPGFPSQLPGVQVLRDGARGHLKNSEVLSSREKAAREPILERFKDSTQ